MSHKLDRTILEECLNCIQRSGNQGRTYPINEISEILTRLENLGCIKSYHAGSFAVESTISEDDAIRNILFGNSLIKFKYVQGLPEEMF